MSSLPTASSCFETPAVRATPARPRTGAGPQRPWALGWRGLQNFALVVWEWQRQKSAACAALWVKTWLRCEPESSRRQGLRATMGLEGIEDPLLRRAPFALRVKWLFPHVE